MGRLQRAGYLALWLCLAGEVGSALEQESAIALAVPVRAVTISVWACSVALGSSVLGPSSSHQPSVAEDDSSHISSLAPTP